jgi:hypothetical protein
MTARGGVISMRFSESAVSGEVPTAGGRDLGNAHA